MQTPQQCLIVCDNKVFQTVKWTLSGMSVGLTSAFVAMLEIS